MSDPPRASSLPTGYDEDDPYADEPLSTYPDWWRRNVEAYRDHDMRPYRPPRFADDEVAPPLIDEVETALGVDVRFCAVNPHEGNDWELRVDGECVRAIDHERVSEGFTRYGMSADEFEAAVRDAAEAASTDD